MKLCRLVSVLSLILAAPSYAIIGGEEVKKEDSVAQFTVGYYSGKVGGENDAPIKGVQWCTAVLIDSKTFLTAAHCVDEVKKPLEGKLYFASTVHKHDGPLKNIPSRPITKITIHEKWNRTGLENDIAIGTFSGGLPPGYSPISLPAVDIKLTKNDLVTIAGYGVSEEAFIVLFDGAGVLRKADLHFGGMGNEFEGSKNDMVLMYPKGKGVCHGDSGSPNIVNNAEGKPVVIGITSMGTSTVELKDDLDCFNANSTVSAYVPNFLGWIAKNR